MSNNSKAFHRRKAVLFTNKPPSDQNHLSNFFCRPKITETTKMMKNLWLIGGIMTAEIGLGPKLRQPRLNQTCTDLTLSDYCQDICIQRLGLCFQECSSNDVMCMRNCARKSDQKIICPKIGL